MNTPIQLYAGGTQTSSTNVAGVNAGTLAGGGSWSPASAALMVVAVPVTTLKRSAGNETYSMKVQDSPDGTTWTDRSVNRFTSDDGAIANTDGAGGTVTFFADIKNPANVRLVTTLGGTSPSITIGAVTLAPAFTFWVQATVMNYGVWLSLAPTAGSTELGEAIFVGSAGGARNLDLANLLTVAGNLLPQGTKVLVAIAPTG